MPLNTSRLAQVISYVAAQNVLAPLRWRSWRRLREPFVHTSRDGPRFKLYPPELIDGYIYVEGIYERRVLRYLRRHLAGRTMLDIGANIGNHALYLASCFQQVHCFEPNPKVVARLRENIALNHFANIHVHPVALGEQREDLPFRSNNKGNLGGGSFVRGQFEVSDVLPVFNGDSFLSEHGIRGIDFIKLDVEGFETQVLRGLKQTIEDCRPILAFEYDHVPETRSFDDFRAALPGYVFAEAIRTSPQRTALGRLKFVLRNGLEPPLVPLHDPEPRFYEAVLAFPSMEILKSFQTSPPPTDSLSAW